MQDVVRAIGRLSQSNVTVLITGESGTGKELVAMALHRHSPRASAPFIALNTAAIPKELLESELFGHERGAFTGAQSMRRGRFEQAEGGTLFLDEIGDMPSELQTRLLRVLSDGHFYRVGGHSPMKANVRVIAATHQNLEDLVRAGLFREDLYHRLNVIRLRLPALHERSEDIPMLARSFLQKSARELGVDSKRLSDAAMKLLVTLPFPGNVRQLENLCHWLTVMAPAQVVEIKDLPPEMRGVSPDVARVTSLSRTPVAGDHVARHDASVGGANGGIDGSMPSDDVWRVELERTAAHMLALDRHDVMDALTRQFEATLIRMALRHTGGRRIEAAQRLGIGRNTITRKIQDLGLDDVR
jgi:two-component system nitrogen regulation response regulator GlnG